MGLFYFIEVCFPDSQPIHDTMAIITEIHKMRIMTVSRIYVLGAMVSDIIFNVPDWVQQNSSVHANRVTLSPGGKGLNQATAASRLDAEVSIIACVGNDAFGNELISVMQTEDVNIDYVTRHETANTSIVGIIVKDNVPGFIGAPDASKKITEAEVRKALENINNQDVLLVNFEIPHHLVQIALQIGRDKGATTVLNPAPFFTTDSFVLTYLHLVDVIIPNIAEAQLLTDSDTDNLDDLSQQLRQHGVKLIVMTNGEDGSIFYDGQSKVVQPAFKVEVVDTTGASDAYVGAYCVGLLKGWSAEKTLKFASATAGLACTQHGTMSSMPTLNTVKDLIASNE